MGFLNNTTVTVDAILTKKGRELLAQGTEAFNITKFALSDDEVDYNLWDVTHPNGSDYYGKVIENMPLLEAIPDENHVMRYKLVTLPKSTSKMPTITIQGITNNTITFDDKSSVAQSAVVGAHTETVTDSSYTFILHDQTICRMSGNFMTGAGGFSTPFFLGTDDAPNSHTEIASGDGVTIHVIQLTTRATTQLTIVGNDTGATASVTIVNNLVTKA
jgi:hypothetical protein